MANISSDNASALLYANGLIVGVSSVNIALTLAAIITLYRCRRMTFRIKRLSYNIFLSDTLLNVLLVATCIWRMAGVDEEQLLVVQYSAIGTAYLISMASVVALAFDRLVAITKPLRYTLIINKRIIFVITLCIWLIHAVIPLLLYTITTVVTKKELLVYLPSKSEPFYRNQRLLLVSFYAIYHSFIIFAYLKISKVMKKHAIAIVTQMSVSTIDNNTNKPRLTMSEHFTTTSTIVKIVLSSELTSLPTLIHSLLYIFFPNLEGSTVLTSFEALTYMSYCGNLYACLFIYVWKMKECRFAFLSIFSMCNKHCRDRTERLKIEVYDIVTYKDHHRMSPINQITD